MPHLSSLHQFFEAQAQRTPDAVAMIFAETSLSYRELDRRADRLARRLRYLGVGPESAVGIFLERSADLLTALLGVLKAGGFYIPVDPQLPEQRLAFLATDTNAPVWLTDKRLARRLPFEDERIVCLDQMAEDAAVETPDPLPEADPANLAYMIYTSGSTGRPKGVQITHRSAINLLTSMAQRPGLTAADTQLAVITTSFDMSVPELFLPLMVGARVVVAPRSATVDGEVLGQLVERHEITAMAATPTTWRLMLAARWVGYKELHILSGGEPLPGELAAQLLARGASLWNGYGPTETTVYSAIHQADNNEQDVAMGRPVENTELYLANPGLRAAPAGAPGELVVGGAGPARGYWRRPGLTAERFVPDPWSVVPGARVYRTGDLVSCARDGIFHYEGRIDHQVKIRGYRIELGEIEATLRQHPELAEAVVTTREDQPGNRRLVAYVVAHSGDGGHEQESWKSEQVSQWQDIYEDVYARDDSGPEADFTRLVWKSSYTGEPMPGEEIREALDEAIGRIEALAPDRILELGCGSGSMLIPLAERCSFYCGTDFSQVALRDLEKRLRKSPVPAEVVLHHRTAADFSGFSADSFDAVVVHSVAQYFPDMEYLLEVLEGAAGVVRPGGFLYLGDLRSLPLMEAFHASVRLYQAPFSLPRQQLLQQVKWHSERETELFVDPAFFPALAERLPVFQQAWTWQKRGLRDNEMTRFRYDVILAVGDSEGGGAPPILAEELKWETLGGLDAVRHYLATENPPALLLRRVPNARLQKSLRTLELLADERGPSCAGVLREVLSREEKSGIHPEDLWRLEEDLPYSVDVSAASAENGYYDVFLTRHQEGVARPLLHRVPASAEPSAGALHSYVNNPLQGTLTANLVPSLQAFLKQKLPEYMVPTAFVVLEELPLTPNRKVDRRSLPAPDSDPSQGSEDYVAPRDDTEQDIARTFGEILGMARPGIRDDFFDLGGHSLLGTQLTYRLRDLFGVDLPLNVLFQAPTVEELAQRIDELRGGPQGPRFAAEDVPAVIDAVEERFESFPLNDIQQAYWIGSDPALELGGVACRFYQQFDSRGLDMKRLEQAWQRLVERHEMLRAVVDTEGRQRILEQVVPYAIEVLDLRGLEDAKQQERIAEERWRQLAEIHPEGEWPLFAIRGHRLADDQVRLHVSLDLLVVDGLSILNLFEEWARFYEDPDQPLPTLPVSFRDYARAERQFEDSASFERAREYWRARVPSLPPAPELPLRKNPIEVKRPELVRRSAELRASSWQALKNRAQRAGLWPSALLCAAYAELVSAWVKEPHFTLNLTLFNRLAVHPEINRVVGDFTTLNLLEVDYRTRGNFVRRARSLQEQLFADLDHRHFSGVKVLRELTRDRLGTTARMPVVFTSFLEDFSRTEWLGPVVDRLGQTPQVWLDNVIIERGGVLEIEWYVVDELFPAGLLPAMFETYLDLLRRLAEEDAPWAEDHPLRLPAAQFAEREAANRTDAPPCDELLHSFFVAQAGERPAHPAVSSDDRTLSYGELYRRSNRLAHRLRNAGVRPNSLVAVVMEKGWEQVVAVLAILEAGAAYLPLEADWPGERLRTLLERGQAEWALTQKSVGERFAWPSGVGSIVVDPDDDSESPVPLSQVQGPEDLAYVIFTSGSTGSPKGVMIDHRGAVNTILDINRRFNIGPQDRVLALSSLAFDLSVYDIFGVLAAGGTIVIPSSSERREPSRWAEWIERREVTVWNSVPALLEILVDHVEKAPETRIDSLRLVLLSGDWIPLSLPERLRRLVPAEVISLGGATEASIWSIFYPISEIDPEWRSVPYGRPLGNQTFHILNRFLHPAPVWVPGHLYIGGVGLAKGYWRDEERTRASFFTHPTSDVALYRTGDLGRYLPDGNIEFLGREDGQVKLRGFRIEVGEIEAALEKHAAVREGVVLLHGDAPAARGSGSQRLIAYLACHGGGQDTEELSRDLRGFLGSLLPEYMVPSTFVFLDELPLTANGKVDRKALRAPEEAATPKRMTAPATETEKRLAEIWSQFLGVTQVGREAHFFELGGHSLVGIRVLAKVRETLGVELSLDALIQAPTLEALAGRIAEQEEQLRGGASTDELPLLVTAPDERFLPFPLNDIQQAYWSGRHRGLELGGVVCCSYQQYTTEGLDMGRLEQAWQHLIERHEMLRAVVDSDGRQRILERVPPYKIPVRDLRGLGVRSREERIASDRKRILSRVPPPGHWPLFAIEGHLIDEDRMRLHVYFDVLTVDGLSILILLEEWRQLYENLEVVLPPVSVSFRDYVLAQEEFERSRTFARSREYWLARVPSLPAAPALPLVKNPAEVEYPEFARRRQNIDEATWQALKNRAQSAGLWPSVLLCAAFAEALGAWVKEPHFTLNLTLFHRLPVHPDINRVVGDFTVLNLLEVDGRRPDSFVKRARRLQDQLFADREHRHFSGVRVLRELARGGSARSARMPVVFTSFLEDFADADWLGPVADRLGQTPQVWLDHLLVERNGALELEWYTIDELFPSGLLAALFEAYVGLLRLLAEEEDTWHETYPLRLPGDQMAERLLANATDTPISEALLHSFFLARAAEQPEDPAVITAGRVVSYRELHRRSNQLAHRLRKAGVRPNSLVAVVMEKGWEQVVAVLAILEAGAAYLPIEAELPQERLLSLLERGQADVALTQSRVDARLAWPPEVRRTAVDLEAVDDTAPRPLRTIQRVHDLAYVIFTSGSTGAPKGVMIDHRGAVNTILDINRRFGVGPKDRVLALSSLSFDLSVYDIFGVLAAGGAVVLPATEERREPGRWAKWIELEGVTLWNSVPALLELLMDHLEKRPGAEISSLRLALLSGDWIPLTLPERLRRAVPGAEVISLGGATEASIWSIFHPIAELAPEWRSVPYGRPLRNQVFYVLNEFLEPSPVWVPGHLYIGGIGLAQGYWRDEERTRESFFHHPRNGERLYRTGDLGRYLPGGDIEFLGREDGQVKLQGHRVELGEIESTLELHPELRGAVVVAKGPVRGPRRLVAYFVANDKVRPDIHELRDFLAGKLPGYMVPTLFVELDALPLSANGKVDRKALPEPEGLDVQLEPSVDRFEAPRDRLEEELAEMTAVFLDCEKLSINDDFFAQGGNSLMAIRLISNLWDRYQVEVPIVRFYDAPSVAGLALALRQAKEAGGRRSAALIPRRPDDAGPAPLSFVQEGLWYLDQLDPTSSRLCLSAFLRLRGQLQAAALEGAIHALIERHEALRTSFLDTDAGPRQVAELVAPPWTPRVDLRALDDVSRRAEVDRLIRFDALRPIDLTRPPLLRTTLVQTSPSEHMLLLTIHHIVSDAWSFLVFVREMASLYQVGCANSPALLPKLPIRYSDFAAWQRQQFDDEELKPHLSYWQRKLAGNLPVLELPIDHPRPPSQRFLSLYRHRSLPLPVSTGIKAFGRQEGVTPFTVLLATTQALLHRYTGQDDIIVGSPVAGRRNKEVEGVVGYFLNTLALRADLSGAPSFRQLLRQLREVVKEAQEHQDLPFPSLVKALRPPRDSSRSAVYQALFLMVDSLLPSDLETPELTFTALRYTPATVMQDLMVSIDDRPEGLEVHLVGNRDLFEGTTLEGMLEHFERLLEGILAEPDRPLIDLPLDPRDESAQDEWDLEEDGDFVFP